MVNEYVSPTPAPTIPSVIVLPWFISCVIALSVVLLLVLGMLSRSSSRKRGSGSSSSIETAPITDNSEGALVYLLQAMLVGTDELRAEPDELAEEIWRQQKTRSHPVKKRWVEIKQHTSWEWMANQAALAKKLHALRQRMSSTKASYSDRGVFQYNASTSDGRGRKSFIVIKNTTVPPGKSTGAKRPRRSAGDEGAGSGAGAGSGSVAVRMQLDFGERVELFIPEASQGIFDGMLFEMKMETGGPNTRQLRGHLVALLIAHACKSLKMDKAGYTSEMEKRERAVRTAHGKSRLTKSELYKKTYQQSSIGIVRSLLDQYSLAELAEGSRVPGQVPATTAAALAEKTAALDRVPGSGRPHCVHSSIFDNVKTVGDDGATASTPIAPRTFSVWEEQFCSGGGGGGGGGASGSSGLLKAAVPKRAPMPVLPEGPLDKIPDEALHPEAPHRAAAQARAASAALVALAASEGKAVGDIVLEGEVTSYTSQIGALAGRKWEADSQLAKKHAKSKRHMLRRRLANELLPKRRQPYDSSQLVVTDMKSLTTIIDTFVLHEQCACGGSLQIDSITAQKLASGTLRLRCSTQHRCALADGGDGGVFDAQGRMNARLTQEVTIQTQGRDGDSTKTFSRAEVALVAAFQSRGMIGTTLAKALGDLGLYLQPKHQAIISKAVTHAVNEEGEFEQARLVSIHERNKTIEQQFMTDGCHASARNSKTGTVAIIDVKTGENLAQLTIERPFIDADEKIRGPSHRLEPTATLALVQTTLKRVSIESIFHDQSKQTSKIVEKHKNPTQFKNTKEYTKDQNDKWHWAKNKRKLIKLELERSQAYKYQTQYTPFDFKKDALPTIITHAIQQVEGGAAAREPYKKAAAECKTKPAMAVLLQRLLLLIGTITFTVKGAGPADAEPAAAAAAAEPAAVAETAAVAEPAAEAAEADDEPDEPDVAQDVDIDCARQPLEELDDGDDGDGECNALLQFVGRRVLKVFDGSQYGGVVASVDVDADAGTDIVLITYDDGDEETVEAEELVKMIVPIVPVPAAAGLGGDVQRSLELPMKDLMSTMQKKTKVGGSYTISTVSVNARDLSDAATILLLNEATRQLLYYLEEPLQLNYVEAHESKKDKKKARNDLQAAADDIVRDCSELDEEVIIALVGAEVPEPPEGTTTTQRIIRLAKPAFEASIIKKSTRSVYEGNTHYKLDFTDARKRTRKKYFLIYQHRWMDFHKGTRTLTFLQKFVAHVHFCICSGLFTTGAELYAGIFNIFCHIIGDHAACGPTCSHSEPEPWQKNEEYIAQVKALEAFMRTRIRENECAGIVDGGETHRIERFFSFLLTFRPKNVHFPLLNCRARCQCGRLDWNVAHEPCAVCVKHGKGREGEIRYRAEWRERAWSKFLYAE